MWNSLSRSRCHKVAITRSSLKGSGMHKLFRILAVIAVVGIFGSAQADPVRGETSQATVLTQEKVLLQEWNALEAENDRLESEAASIAALEESLNARLTALQKTETALKAETTRLERAAMELAPKVAWYEEHCISTSEKEDLERVAKCNAEEPELLATTTSLKNAALSLDKKSAAARKERRAVTEGAFSRVKRRAKLTFDTSSYTARKEEWLRRAYTLLEPDVPVDAAQVGEETGSK